MAGMSMKEIARIIEFIEPQGVGVTRTKKGLLLRLPNGDTDMIHFTNSDHRAYANTRARLRRAGIDLPTDRHAAKNLPDYITAGSMRATTLDRARRILEEMGSPGRITSNAFMEAGGAPTHGLANRTLYHLGWLPQTDKKRAHKIWIQPIDQEDEPMTEEQLLERVERNANATWAPFRGAKGSVAHRVYQLLAETGQALSTTEIREKLPDAHATTVSSSLSNLKKREVIALSQGRWHLESISPQIGPDAEQVEEPEPEAEDDDEQDELPRTGIHGHVGDREFIDSVNSWALDLAILGEDMSIDQLKRTLRAAGLDFEVRVWHENENDNS